MKAIVLKPFSDGDILYHENETIEITEEKFSEYVEAGHFIMGVGGGSGGASSWNDLTDKPFGDELVEILPETEVEFVYDDAEAIWVGEFQAKKVVGNENNYIVVYNGVEYRGTSAHGCMGNTAISGGEDNGMPFFIMPIDENGGHLIISLDELPKTTVSIKEFVSTPIPSKYMPKYELLDLVSLGVGELNTTNKQHTINFSDTAFLERAYKQGIIQINVSVPIKYGTTENIGERIIWGFIMPTAGGYEIHCPITGGQLYIYVSGPAETLSVTYDQFYLK